MVQHFAFPFSYSLRPGNHICCLATVFVTVSQSGGDNNEGHGGRGLPGGEGCCMRRLTVPRDAGQPMVPRDAEWPMVPRDAGQPMVPRDAGQSMVPVDAGQSMVPRDAGWPMVPVDAG